jgi:hypothetical protein
MYKCATNLIAETFGKGDDILCIHFPRGRGAALLVVIKLQLVVLHYFIFLLLVT